MEINLYTIEKYKLYKIYSAEKLGNYDKNLKIYENRLQQRSYSLCQIHIMSINYAKDIKIKSIETITMTSLSTLKTFSSAEISHHFFLFGNHHLE